MKLVKFSTYITDIQHEQLRTLAFEKHISIAKATRFAIDGYLGRQWQEQSASKDGRK